jgi:hypothetical protein
MNINQALIIVSKPKLDSPSSHQQWSTFLNKSKEILSSGGSARRIAENSLVLSFDSPAKNFLRATTESGLHYEAFLVWEMPLEIIQSFDPAYSGTEKG